MSDSESEGSKSAVEPASAASKEAAPPVDVERPFVEEDSTKTVIPYDKGGLPIYIALAWVAFIIAYVTVMSIVALPDLKAWLSR
jgi:hypothetical protein